jgi:hypothetical protein
MARKRNKERVGDILGLGDTTTSSIRGSDATIHPHSDADAAQRHRRMSEGADEVTPTATAPHRSTGATGIDMGSGGEGTDLE